MHTDREIRAARELIEATIEPNLGCDPAEDYKAAIWAERQHPDVARIAKLPLSTELPEIEEAALLGG